MSPGASDRSTGLGAIGWDHNKTSEDWVEASSMVQEPVTGSVQHWAPPKPSDVNCLQAGEQKCELTEKSRDYRKKRYKKIVCFGGNKTFEIQINYVEF